MTPVFTQDWFTGREFQLKLWLAPFVGKPVKALEIGCFEGRSTLFFLLHILTHRDSTITCVDTFEGSQEHHKLDMSRIRDRFVVNVSDWPTKVRLWVGRSFDVLPKLQAASYDFIYVDGSHRADDVFQDAELAWPLLKPEGLLIFDDYLWPGHLGTPQWTPLGIDRFLTKVKSESVQIPAYQLAISKKP